MKTILRRQAIANTGLKLPHYSKGSWLTPLLMYTSFDLQPVLKIYFKMILISLFYIKGLKSNSYST